LQALLTQKAAAEAEVMAEVEVMVAGEVMAAADISAEVDTAAVAGISAGVALAVHISAARVSAAGLVYPGLRRDQASAANARWRSMVIGIGPLAARPR
jgi:hypothetical protein